MKLFILTAFLAITTTVMAQDNPICENGDGKFTDLTIIAGKNCLTDEIGSADLKDFISNKTEVKEFCKNCKSEVLNKTLNSTEAMSERESLYGKAILNEFQKNLTFLTVDLMRVRSGFRLNFDGNSTIKNCNFKNLKKPTCLNKEQEKLYDEQILNIQNSMAQEMANILSENPSSDKSFLDRSTSINECKLKDRDVIFSQNRFNESLLTPDFILKIKELNIPKGVNALSYVKNANLGSKWEEPFRILMSHPIFNILLSDTTKLHKFTSEISSSSTHDTIVDKLYSDQVAKDFSIEIDKRCNEAFAKTNDLLKTNFCEQTPPFIADDLYEMENIVGEKFGNLSNDEAEPHLQMLCSHINTSTSKMKTFTEIQKGLHSEQNLELAKTPMASFKQKEYAEVISQSMDKICRASKGTPDCKIDKADFGCGMLHFFELSKTSKPYQDMAKASGENINLILRSLVGDGKPETQEHLVLLQNEGILPGGEVTDKPVQQDAETFHKTVNASNGTIPNLNQKTSGTGIDPKTGRKIASTDPNNESVMGGSNFAYNSKGSGNKNNEPEFSNLDDDEQNEIMDRLGRMKNSRKNKKLGQTDNSSTTNEQTGKNGRKAFFTKPAVADNTYVKSPVVNESFLGSNVKGFTDNSNGNNGTGHGGVNKQNRNFNSALLNANQNPVPINSDVTPTINQLSKTKDGENEINIQVPDTELAETLKFKEKLKELLAAHNQELSVIKVGEKFLVKLNDYEIDVYFDAKSGLYTAKCRNGEIPVDYEKTISNYFNVTLKQGPGKIKSLKEAFQITNN